MKIASALRMVWTTKGSAVPAPLSKTNVSTESQSHRSKMYVVVIVGAGGAQHDEVAAAAVGAHADVVLVHVVAAALGDPEAARLPHDVVGIPGEVVLVSGAAPRRPGPGAGGKCRDDCECQRRDAPGAVETCVHGSIRESR